MSDKHECPYRKTTDVAASNNMSSYCGLHGERCPACREDRADARAEVLRDVINTGFDNVAQTLWDKKP